LDSFTPLSGLIGGLLIGGAASLFVLLNGRVAGISGIYGGLLAPTALDWHWRVAFILGIAIGPVLVGLLGGGPAAIVIDASWPTLVVGGLLVGYGARLGSGCTSGHGVCGMARGSPRSLIATMTFFSTAALTVFFMRHIWS